MEKTKMIFKINVEKSNRSSYITGSMKITKHLKNTFNIERKVERKKLFSNRMN